MIFFSAHDKVTLQRNIAAHAKIADKFYLADLAHTLNTKRTKFPQRAFTVAHQGNDGEDFDISSFRFASVSKKPLQDLAFIFTGQGAQWAGMAVEAMKTLPSFLETIRGLDHVLQHLNPPASWRLEDVLLTPADSSPINDAEIAQPICTAVQIAIADLFARWQIVPNVTAGHSSGEIGAAYAAGLISAPEAIIVAFYRGFAVKHHAPAGAMLAVGMGVKDIFDHIGDLDDIVVACENSPSSVTLSGTFEAVQKVKSRLDVIKVFARELKTGKAYHSPQMSDVVPAYNVLHMRVTLRDIVIGVALVIPDTDDGVEVQLRLQESPKTTTQTIWYSFAVESISHGRWTLHCEGLIAPQTSLENRDSSSPVDVSKLIQRVTSKRWYNAFHRVGFQYEGSFQPLSQIRTNRKYHHAAANVKTSVESSLMPAESR